MDVFVLDYENPHILEKIELLHFLQQLLKLVIPVVKQ
jgi:hypothetical protein